MSLLSAGSISLDSTFKQLFVIKKTSKGSKNVPVGAGAVIRIYGSAEPEPKEIITGPQHCFFFFF
jgi:hypothetical protein